MVTAWSDQCARIIGHWGVSLKAEASQNIWNIVEKKVKKTSSKARQLLPPGLPHCPASLGMALHTPVCDCPEELGTQKLFVLPSVQTVPCGEGLSLSAQEQTHPQAGAASLAGPGQLRLPAAVGPLLPRAGPSLDQPHLLAFTGGLRLPQ